MASRSVVARGMAVGVLLLAGRPAAAQQTRPLAEPPEFALDQWTTENGLPQNSITAIAQTPDGYLWVGTFGGLARFDGTTFRLTERRDSSGRHIDRVLSLAVGPDSSLWIGTESGLLRYHHDVFEVYTSADGLPHDEIAALHVDRTGTLWIGTPRGVMARFSTGRFQVFDDVEGAPLLNVIAISEDADGTLWVNAADRFLTLEGGSLSTARWRAPAAAGALNMVLQDRAGAYWFSLANGVARASRGGFRAFGPDAGVRRPSAMVEDPEGGYWVATANDGLFFFRPDGASGSARHYALPDGRAAYRVRATLVDVDGHVWFGTNANGLLRARRNVFTTYTSAQGLSHDVVTAVYADAGGTMWVGTNCFGLNAIDLERRAVRTFKPRRPGDPGGDPCVFALTEGPRGTMWVGTWGGGLTRVTGGREEWLRRKTGLRDSVVRALFTDRDGTVWVGTNSGGLAALRDGRVRAAYTTADGLAHNSVRVVYQTRDGALWIGTLEGLSRLQDGRITSYTAAAGLSAQHVRAIHEDRDGNLWIGTYGGGLNRLRDGRFTAVTRQDGLADDVVSSILEDDQGRLWMSGNRGIASVARDGLLAFTEGRARRVHSVLYREGDGLGKAETNGGFQPAAWKDPRGRMWFPTVQGVAVVDPARVAVHERPPQVAVEAVVVDGVSRPAAASIAIGPGRPNLEVRYAGLSLAAPQHLTFRYRLYGFDDDWVDAADRRVAYYPRLPPGRYRFVVTAANRDGVWNQTGTELRLRVAAPFWSTWWFRLAVVGGLLGFATALVRRRNAVARRWRAAHEEFSRRLLESQERERKRIAGELHDGLGQELLVIKNRALLALRADGVAAPVREQLEQISEVVGQSLDNVRGLAHNLAPYQLEHVGLTAALRAMIDAAGDTATIAFTTAVDDIDGSLPVEGQINLYRIVQEAVSNIVRHSGARTAAVFVRRAGDAIAVTIRDDGRGFAVSHDGAGRLAGGFGLSGIAERSRILDGRLDVASAPGQGTRLDLSVPVAARASLAASGR